MAGRPINEDLATAKIVGDKTYEGLTHERCGTSTRYTSTGSCVHCARAKQAEMRVVHKALTQPAPAALTAPQHATIPDPWD
jgi:hypothetical protein